MRKLHIIESGRSTSVSNRRIAGVDPFDVFIADDKYEISIINFIDLLTKDLEDDSRSQRLQLQKFQATTLGLLPATLE